MNPLREDGCLPRSVDLLHKGGLLAVCLIPFATLFGEHFLPSGCVFRNSRHTGLHGIILRTGRGKVATLGDRAGAERFITTTASFSHHAFAGCRILRNA